MGVPKANSDLICVAAAKPEENQLLRILQMKYRKNKLALLVRILQMESNPKLLLQSLDLADFAYLLDDSMETAEIDYADYSDEVKALIDACGKTTKFERCVELASSLAKQNKPVIIWCMFVGSIQNLSEALEERGIRRRCIYGEVPLEDRQQILADFRSGKIQALLPIRILWLSLFRYTASATMQSTLSTVTIWFICCNPRIVFTDWACRTISIRSITITSFPIRLRIALGLWVRRSTTV